MTVPQAFDLALQRHRAGRLADAETLYRQILAVQPNHAGALHLLGRIAHQAGRHDLAIEWIRQSIALNPNNSAAHRDLGETCRAAGRPAEATAAYRGALELEPDQAEAHNNLGAALAAEGRLDEAIAAWGRALELKPDFPEPHHNLGNALKERGQLAEAVAAYRRALELKPDYPDTHVNLGNALRGQGQLEEAVAAYRRGLQFKPGYPEAHNNLGGSLAALGRQDEAIAAYRRALELKPDYSEAHNNLGAALAMRGQLDEAIAAYHRAIQFNPGLAETHHNLGAALKDRGRLDEAIAACRRALELKPDYPEAYNSLGNALRDRGWLDEAMAACRRALELKPGYPEAHTNLGNALKERGQLDEAIALYRHALELKPDFPKACNNLGNALRDRGEVEGAIGAFRRALELKPDSAEMHSNLVYTLNFHPGSDLQSISEEHQRWNRQFSEPLQKLLQPHANDRDPNRKLRVGYVSPDFRDHPVGRYLLPLFEHHDRERFDILCYSGVARFDWITEHLRALAGCSGGGRGWRDTLGISDARLAEMIREDRVDILVDLSLHTAGNRLPMFARQPAPVQVTWLGYPGSTGLPGIGYRLTDPRMDPQEVGLVWSAEEPVRLPDCWCCYQPPGECPEINALPVLSTRRLTFGSLNNFAKVNESVLALWARVLKAVKGSRLLMFSPEGSARKRVRAYFETQTIPEERVELVGFQPSSDYLQLYQRIDIALDPFPCNGMTTTCDAMWMGVPVLTLPGDMPISRAGLSLLSTIGLGDFAATSEDDYVRLAVELAGNLPRLADLRSTLRPRIVASPLMDAPRFARNVEAAYIKMWEHWRLGISPARNE